MTRLKKITHRKGVYLEWSIVECNKHNIDALDLTAFSPFQPVNGWYRILANFSKAKRDLFVLYCHDSKYYQAAVFHGVLHFRMRVRRVPTSF